MPKKTYLSQTPFVKDLALVQDKKKKFGFINSALEEVIPCNYEYATPFAGEVARVQQKTGWGLIDRAGKVILPCEFDDLSHDISQTVQATKEDKKGLYDTAGKLLIPIEFEELEEMPDNHTLLCYSYDAQGESTGFAVYDRAGKVIVKKNIYAYMRIHATEHITVMNKKNQWGVIDKAGNIILPLKYDSITEREEGEGEGYLQLMRGEYYGVADRAGKLIFDAKYSQIYIPTYQNAVVVPYYLVLDSKEKMGVFDKNGTVILPPKYDTIEIRNEDFIIVRDKQAFVLNKKQEKISPAFSDMKLITDGYVACMHDTGLWAIYDYAFQEIVPAIFEYVDASQAVKDCIVIIQRNLFGLYNLPAKALQVPAIYSHLSAIDTQKSDCFIIQKDKLYGIIDTQNTRVAPQYKDLTSLYYTPEYLIVCDTAHKMGVITAQNEMKIPFAYDEITDGYDEDKPVVLARTFHSFDRQGKPLPAQPFIVADDLYFVEGWAAVRHKATDLYGYINENQEIVIPFEYEDAQIFQDGYAIVAQAGKYGVIDRAGKWQIKPQYALAYPAMSEGTVCFGNEEGQYGLFNLQNEVILPFGSTEPIDILEGWARYLQENGLHALLNLETRQVLVRPNTDFYLFKEGFALAYLQDTQKYAFYDTECAFAFDDTLVFDCGEAFDNGAVLVWNEISSNLRQFKVITKAGKVIFDQQAHYVERVGKDFLKIQYAEGDNFVFANLKGKLITKTTFENISLLPNGNVLLREPNKLYNAQTQKIYPLPYSEIEEDTHKTYFRVGKFDIKADAILYGIMHESGALVVECQYLFLEIVGKNPTCAFVLIEGKYGVIDFQNNLIVPAIYQDYRLHGEKIVVMSEEVEIVLG